MSNKEEKYNLDLSGIENLMDESAEPTAEDRNQIQDPIDYYIIGDKIATGGLKTIWKAHDRRTGRAVALAKLKPESNHGFHSERFIIEAKILSNLEHTNIVPLYGFNCDSKGELFFTMKLLSGQNLASILRKLKIGDSKTLELFPPKKLLDIFVTICDAISYAHDKGVVHLDLKPENIQISDYGEISVIDWGMAQYTRNQKGIEAYDNDLPGFVPLVQSGEDKGGISGTPGYMAPEQASGDSTLINEQTDIYALGAILYAILYKIHPHKGLDINDILKNTEQGELPEFPKKSDNQLVPSALRAIAKKAMMHSHENRYNDVRSLQKDIILYMNDFATQAENISLIKFGSLFIKRHTKILGILAAFIIITGTISYVSYDKLKQKDAKLLAQSIKVDATAEEIIEGTLNKHNILREEHAFTEVLENYEKLKNVGYSYPEFWYDEARLYIGQLDFNRALILLEKVNSSTSSIRNTEAFKKAFRHTAILQSMQQENKLPHDKLIELIQNMDILTRKHVYWTLNQDATVRIKERIEKAAAALKVVNKIEENRAFHFEYKIQTDGYITLSVNNNFRLRYILPLYGLPIDELDASDTSINTTELKNYFKKQLTALDISNTKSNILNSYIKDSVYEKLIIKNKVFDADLIDKAPRLKHLNIEGSQTLKASLNKSDTLEYLNIAFTDFKDLTFLKDYPKLKTLVIDSTMSLPSAIKSKLLQQGVEIALKERAKFKIPGNIEAEDYTTMFGIYTNKAYDIGSGKFVGWLETGDYLTYNVDIRESGKYLLTARLAGKHFSFTLHDNENLLWQVNEPGTGGWQDWKTIKKEIHLPGGENQLKLKCSGPGWNINWMKFELIE